MNRTNKYSKEHDKSLSIHTTAPLAASITGWKLQDKNSNIYPIPTHRVFILNSESRVKNLSKIKLVLLDILIRGQRAENASPPTLLNRRN